MNDHWLTVSELAQILNELTDLGRGEDPVFACDYPLLERQVQSEELAGTRYLLLGNEFC